METIHFVEKLIRNVPIGMREFWNIMTKIRSTTENLKLPADNVAKLTQTARYNIINS